MTTIITPTLNQDERVMAALAHVSVLLPLMGVIVPISIWMTQKGKSSYVAFQSLQAIAYQLSMVVAYFIGMGCYMLSLLGIFVAMPLAMSQDNSQSLNLIFGLSILIPIIIFGAIIVGGFLLMIYGTIGAIMAFQGKPFRYWIIGRRVERFLQPKQEAVTNQTPRDSDETYPPVSL